MKAAPEDVRMKVMDKAIKLADAVLRMGPVRIMRNDDEVRCRICGVSSRTGKIRHAKGCAYAAYEKVRKLP